MSFQYSTPERVSRAATGVAMTERSHVHKGRDEEPNQIDAGHREPAIDQPGVHQRGKRQEYETQDQEEKAMKGPVQVVREQEEEHQPDARKRQDQDQE